MVFTRTPKIVPSKPNMGCRSLFQIKLAVMPAKALVTKACLLMVKPKMSATRGTMTMGAQKR